MAFDYEKSFDEGEMARRIDELVYQFESEHVGDFDDVFAYDERLHALTDRELEELILARYYSPKKATALGVFLGIFGADSCYLGNKKRAILKLLTLGGLGILWIYDIFHEKTLVTSCNRAILENELHKFGK